MLPLLLALGLVAGAALPIQAAINGQLARHMGGAVTATAISFAAGGILLGLAGALMPRETGFVESVKATPPWLLVTGGMLGAAYVTSVIILTPKLGTAATMAFIVSGQLLAGLLIDHLGQFNLAVREITFGRVAGAALLLAGALLIRVY